jgi:RNA polymerase sigma factor (sigma-70 family)
VKENEPDINALVRQCLNGNTVAQHALYERYSRAMHSTAVRILGQNEDAEDALQESFVKAFLKLNSFTGSASFGAWLKRITINECLNRLRKKKLEWPDLNFDIADERDDEPLDIDAAELNDLIAKLPSGCKTVFCLKAIEDYSHEEISVELNISLSTSKSQFARAKELLHFSLKKRVKL